MRLCFAGGVRARQKMECSNQATKEWYVWAGLFGNIMYQASQDVCRPGRMSGLKMHAFIDGSSVIITYTSLPIAWYG